MKTQNFGRDAFHWSALSLFAPSRLLQFPSHKLSFCLVCYRISRENGSETDNPKRPFPNTNLDSCSDFYTDFDRENDKKRGYPTKDSQGKNERYWFIVKHKQSGKRIEGFYQEPGYEEGFPDKDKKYWYRVVFTDSENPEIREWMAEKDLNYLDRIQQEDPVLYRKEIQSLKDQNDPNGILPRHAARQPKQAKQPLKQPVASPAPLPSIPVIGKAKALYPYSAEQPEQLSFVLNEELDVLNNVGNWWQCRNQLGQVGSAPYNYVQMITSPVASSLGEVPLPMTPGSGAAPAASLPAASAQRYLNFTDLQFGAVIAEGSFGKVSKGKWLHTPVAIKEPHGSQARSSDAAIRQLYEVFQQSLQHEAAIMVDLDHPNIVKFYGLVVEPRVCVVMELMHTSLDVLLSSASLSWSLRYGIALGIARGLNYLHHKALLHRDLKSPNILLDTHHQAKLSDYGTSKYGTSYSTQSLYSPFWLAPELLIILVNPSAQVNYTQACDVYSFAIVLWELASQKIPNYIAPAALINGTRQVLPQDTPPSMASLITACWDKEPGKRMTMTKVIEEIEAHPIVESSSVSSFSSSSSSSSSRSASSSSAGRALPPRRPKQQMQAVEDYDGDSPDDLSFREGDVLTVLSKQEDGWWQCELEGRRGLVPSNFLEPLSNSSSLPSM